MPTHQSTHDQAPARFLLLRGVPMDRLCRIDCRDGFEPPRFMVGGTSSFLPFMPEVLRDARQLWLDGAPILRKIDLPNLPTINYMADPDLYLGALRKAVAVVRRLQRPAFNAPAAVLQTRRDLSADRLSAIPGVHAPRTVRLDVQDKAALVQAILASGLSFPLLVRPAGLHGGRDLVKVDRPEDLATAPIRAGGAVYVTEFVDFSDADGLFRKQRLVIVGGQVFLRHVIIGRKWLLHSDGRAEGTEQEELAAFAKFESETMPAIGPTIEAITRTVDLDHYGIDCSIRPDGTILVFEANACMNIFDNSTIPPPNMWEAPIAVIKEQLRHLLAEPERWRHQGVATPVAVPPANAA